jgi:oxygen-dependent protoporphyrinogen oxidase
MKVAVIGGGATGLAAAWRLSGAGHEVRLFEASQRLGGSVRTDAADGWLIEAGPNSIQESTTELAALISDLGLGPERVVAGASSKKRFIVMGGRLVALPGSPLQFFSTPVMSARTKWMILTEFTKRRFERAGDASVGAFVRDHFGAELVERIVQPFISGIYAGDPERLSTRHAFPSLWEAERAAGSVIRGMIAGAKSRRAQGKRSAPALISFRRGLQELTDTLAAKLPAGAVGLGCEVRSVAPGERARWRVGWRGPQGDSSAEFDSVVAGVPASALAALEIGRDGHRPLAGLAAVEQPPVVSVFLGFRRDQVSHPLDGFGALVPAVERRSILGVIFSSSLFEGRAPQGHVALTALAGGVMQPDVARLPEAELMGRVLGDLGELLGARGEPVFVRRTFWPRAIPQYNLGYDRHLDAIAACERDNPGILIGGNARDGISLADCLKSGSLLAKRVS